MSLILDHKKDLFPLGEKRTGTTISWSPPIANWNAWSGNNIDDGPLATVSLLI